MSLRVGVIGTGAIGRVHIERITNRLTGAAIVAVNDVSRSLAEKAVQDFGINADVFTSGVDLIRSDSVDAVIVASWGPTHEEFVLAAIAAGKPVFCEKPLAVTAGGCKAIVEAEMAAGRKLVQVGFMRRYDLAYRQLKDVIVNNRIGAPLTLNCAHRAPAAPGFAGDMAITDSCVHEFDVLRWLLADDYVSAQVILPRKTSLCDEQLQDPHVIQLRTRSGVHISIESFVNAQYGYDIRCQVTGETGIAHLAQPISVTLQTAATEQSAIIVDWQERFVDAFDREFQCWINDTLKGEMNGPSAWDGYVVAVTADACVKAKYSGLIEAISLPETPAFYA